LIGEWLVVVRDEVPDAAITLLVCPKQVVVVVVAFHVEVAHLDHQAGLEDLDIGYAALHGDEDIRQKRFGMRPWPPSLPALRSPAMTGRRPFVATRREPMSSHSRWMTFMT
jgi:hypothetical protein